MSYFGSFGMHGLKTSQEMFIKRKGNAGTPHDRPSIIYLNKYERSMNSSSANRGVIFFSSMLKDHKCETKHVEKFCVILKDHNMSHNILQYKIQKFKVIEGHQKEGI